MKSNKLKGIYVLFIIARNTRVNFVRLIPNWTNTGVCSLWTHLFWHSFELALNSKWNWIYSGLFTWSTCANIVWIIPIWTNTGTWTFQSRHTWTGIATIFSKASFYIIKQVKLKASFLFKTDFLFKWEDRFEQQLLKLMFIFHSAS